MSHWLARVIDWSLSGFFTNYSAALRYYAPGDFDAENTDMEEAFYG